MASQELQSLIEIMRAAGPFDGDLMSMRKMHEPGTGVPEARRHHLGARRRGRRAGGVGDP